MKPFLYQVASLFYEKWGAEVSRLAFVFPNRRTGLFFQKYLSEVADIPLFSPTILTINDLFIQLSGKQSADRISMLFTLYDIYIRQSGSTETFDEFLYWGEMLLNDFDDIDKYMANARMLFSNVTDLREIENDFDFLSDEQIAAIRSFWSSFYPRGDTPNQQQFLAVWQVLYDLYEEFRATLAAEGKGYEGMIFREVVESMERGESPDLPYEQIVFVGLNALSVSEERFLAQLQKRKIADFYWDYVSDKVTDPDNKASYFVSRNLKSFPSSMKLPPEEKVKTEIEVIGIPSGIGQAKHVYTLLSDWCKEAEMSSEEALRTAVILPDEHLLIPVLNAIPEQIRAYQRHDGLSLGGNPGRLVDRVYLGVAEERTLHRPESVVLFPRRAAGIEPSLHPLHLTGDYFLLGERDHGEQQDLYLAYGVRENAFARNPVHAGDRGGGLLGLSDQGVGRAEQGYVRPFR